MTRPAPTGAPNHLPGPRSGNASFDEACARRDYGLLQAAVADMGKREAVEHLAFLFPHRTPRWFSRNFADLMSLTPEDFGRLIQYADPTGDTAVARAMAAA